MNTTAYFVYVYSIFVRTFPLDYCVVEICKFFSVSINKYFKIEYTFIAFKDKKLCFPENLHFFFVSTSDIIQSSMTSPKTPGFMNEAKLNNTSSISKVSPCLTDLEDRQ